MASCAFRRPARPTFRRRTRTTSTAPRTTRERFFSRLIDAPGDQLQRRRRAPGHRLHPDRPRQLLQPLRSDRPELLHQRRDRHGEQPLRRNHLHLGPRPADLRHLDRQPRGGHDLRSRGQRRAGAGCGTFYARYWNDGVNGGITSHTSGPTCANCGSGDPDTDLSLSSLRGTIGFGDQREPLGLRWAARWFDLTAGRASSRPTSGVARFHVVQRPTATSTSRSVDPDVLRRGREHGHAGRLPLAVLDAHSSTSRYETQQRNITTSSTRPRSGLGPASTS